MRNSAAKHLYQSLPGYLSRLEKDDQIKQCDIERISKLKADMKKANVLPTDLL